MDQDATWYGDRPQPGNIVLDDEPAPLPFSAGLHFFGRDYISATI